jgi:hypothetical protein
VYMLANARWDKAIALDPPWHVNDDSSA